MNHCLPQRWKMLNERSPATVSDVIDIILDNRNIDPLTFTRDLKDLSEHLHIRGMTEGAGLLANHMAKRNKIVVVADYDCDGITSAAQMSLFFQETGYQNFRVVIPCRSEGYGIPERAVLENPDAGVFVALDCGTLDVKPVSLARSMGADCIVIDHHEIPGTSPARGKAGRNSGPPPMVASPAGAAGRRFAADTGSRAPPPGAHPGSVGSTGLAPASVLINPKHPECGSSFKEFCASGLTFLFLAALRRALRDIETGLSIPALGGKYLALAATGTVADLVPLVSANRIIARNGLRNLNANGCLPLSRLATTAGLAGKTLSAGHIGFYLGPRINAAGRISEGQIAYDLLTSNDSSRLTRLAAELEDLNVQRRIEEEKIIRDIGARLAARPATGRTLVMGSPVWKPGVVGIAASRVQQELYYAPVVIFSIDEATGTARGSARSIPGFDIHRALSMCADLLIKWGGHKAAAGLTIDTNRIEEFADRLERIAGGHPAEIFIPQGKVDLELPLTLVGPKLVSALAELEPHGMGNPAPLFALRGARFNSTRVFGKEQNHLKLCLQGGLEAIWWRGAQHLTEEREPGPAAFLGRGLRTEDGGLFTTLCSPMDMIFQVAWDGFNKRAMLEVVDLGRFF